MTSPSREPIPAGVVSHVRGRYQAPVLAWLTRALVVVGVVGAVLPGQARTVLATTSVAAVITAPLLRVAWLVARWSQERDRHFVALGLALLGVVAAGGLLAALGVGG